MSKRSYPFVSDWERPKAVGPNGGKQCQVCGGRPAGRLTVQVSWFRGEDLVIKCCVQCERTHSVQEIISNRRRPPPPPGP